MPPELIATRLALQDLVQTTARALDREDLAGWLALFDAEGEYEISAYSAELRKDTIWWRNSKSELEKLIGDVTRHVRDPARRLHVVGPPLVEFEGDSATLSAAFAIYRTLPSGETSLYLVGRYDDLVVRRGAEWKYLRHRVIAETRVLDIGSHLPL